MIRVLLLQLDGKLPNLALMRLAQSHRELGDHVELRHATKVKHLAPRLGDGYFYRVYASAIFDRSKTLIEAVKRTYPDAIIGGTGHSLSTKLEDVGVPTRGPLDYSDYPRFRASMGFSQRGCRLKCSFCVVPRKEGSNWPHNTIADIWRGEPWPKWLLLLDNDFFGAADWRARAEEIRSGGFRVCFCQGINARFLNEETAECLASLDYCDDSFTRPRIYTAWDNRKDEATLFRGLEQLCKCGVKPDHLMVYMLIGYDHVKKRPIPDVTESDLYRFRQLVKFGARPYPMPFVRTDATKGMQRWAQGGIHKTVPWKDWVANGYRSEGLNERTAPLPLFDRRAES